jgi:hypothetical protein
MRVGSVITLLVLIYVTMRSPDASDIAASAKALSAGSQTSAVAQTVGGRDATKTSGANAIGESPQQSRNPVWPSRFESLDLLLLGLFLFSASTAVRFSRSRRKEPARVLGKPSDAAS